MSRLNAVPSRSDAVIPRRQFMALSSGAALGLGALLAAPARAQTAVESNPFTLGSATGDPTTTSVILWTRLALDPLAADAGMDGQPDSIDVAWGVFSSYADASSGERPVRSGVAKALQADHWSVHVDAGVDGDGSSLTAGNRYWYRFSVKGASKTYSTWVGTFQTAPAASADVNARFAVASCQNYVNRDHGRSYWHAFDHLSADMDIEDPDDSSSRMDFVVHLGDYIYEGGFDESDSAQGIPTVPARPCVSLADYRQRWGWYLDRDAAQRVRRMYSSFVIPDDHELINDVNGARIATSFTGDATRDAQLQQFNDALQAYWENQPLRGGRPEPLPGEDKVRLTITRTVRWGQHLTLMLWDCRQYRTRYSDSEPSILGSAQRADTLDLVNTSEATWTAFGTTSPITSRTSPTTPPGSYRDGWLAFPEEREIICDAIKARRDRSPFNAVFLAGEIHCPVASLVRRTTDPDASTEDVAIEFATPPVSSDGGDWRFLRDHNPESLIPWVGVDPARPTSTYKGYLRCSATATDFYANFMCHGGSSWLEPTATLQSEFTSRTSAGSVAIDPI